MSRLVVACLSTGIIVRLPYLTKKAERENVEIPKVPRIFVFSPVQQFSWRTQIRFADMHNSPTHLPNHCEPIYIRKYHSRNNTTRKSGISTKTYTFSNNHADTKFSSLGMPAHYNHIYDHIGNPVKRNPYTLGSKLRSLRVRNIT